MQLKVKTLAGDKLDVEIDAEESLFAFKAIVCSLREDWDADRLQVVFKGKILSADDSALQDLGVKDGDTMVITNFQKKTVEAAAPAAAAPAPAAATAPAFPAPNFAATAPAAAPAAAAPQMSQAQMMEQFAAALASMGGAPGLGGTMGPGMPGMAQPPPPQPNAPLGQTMPAPSAPVEPTGPLAELQKWPYWPMVAFQVQQDPKKLEGLMYSIAEKAPHLLEPILENHDEFARLLTEPVAAPRRGQARGGRPAQPAAPPPLPELTPEQKAAVDRLCELGFPKMQCLEAYLACDKNEEAAANLLFSD